MNTQTRKPVIPWRYRRLARRRSVCFSPFIYVILLFIGLTPEYSSAEQNPEAVVTMASRNMVDTLQKHHDELVANPEKLYALIENIVVPHFDVKAITRLVLGPHWREATTEQRQHFTDAFKLLVINSYAKVLILHSNDKVQVQPVHTIEAGAHRVNVNSVVKSSSGTPASIVYRLRLKDGVWKIYDFDIEGVSLILNYKHSFSDQIRQKGLDGLIKSIDEKNASFRL